nr:hypothetical protein [Tanacetum cinerariifolium]
MAEKMKAMEDQIFELSVNHREEDDNDTGGSGVRSKGSRQRHSNDIKVEIPEYDGKLYPGEFVEWLRTVECAFDYKDTTEENKVKIVAMKLRKYASTWWANTCTKRERLGKKKNQRPTEEYSQEFEYLLMKCDLPEDDPQTLVWYLGGLETRVANVVELYPYSTLDELTQLAHKLVTLAEYDEGDNSYVVDPSIGSVVVVATVVEEIVGPDEGACRVLYQRGFTNFGLQTEPDHRASSFALGKGIHVFHRILLSLSIGRSYEDKIWCDVIPMDACHVLLGRPWLFDRRVMHDGYQNTYSFDHNNKKIVLTPMSPVTTSTKHPQPLSTLLKAEQQESITDFILMGLDETEDNPPITPNPHIQSLLQSYNHVFPAEIPSRLPPLRTIQHKIDFLPGSVLPNKPAYRSNPQQTDEMRKQVDRLLQKGLIRESLCLCVVPTILVPKKNEEWRICMDSRSINKITIKYRFPIPRLNDMLDELMVLPCFLRTEDDHQAHLQQLFELLDQEKLYGNLDKCDFFTTQVTFLGYLVSAQGIQVDERKVQAIRDWPVPRSIQQVRSFHALASFYRRFVKNFSTLVAPITELTKLKQFAWNSQAQTAFEELKKQLSSTPVLALPCFDEVFEVECDASEVGIGVVLSQLGRPIAYFSEKLNETKQRYSTYDKEFYAIVRALDQATQVTSRHAKWVDYLQAFNFTIQHKSGKLIKGVDALSRKYALVNSLRPRVVGLELLPQNYPSDPDPDFREQFSSCQNHATGEYHIWHLGIDKTLKMLQNHFIWPKMERYVEHYVGRCLPCHQAKSHSSPHGLYMPLPVPVAPWEDISLDFIIANLYFKEIVRLHGIPRSMVSDRDVKFLSHFWVTLWRKMGTKLKFSTSSHPQTDGQTEAEFAYNRAPNKTTGRSPFMVVYGLNPKTPLYLVVLDTSTKFNQEASDRASDINALHQLVHDKITKSNELIKYRRDKGRKHILFQPGDLVWVHFRKDRFPAKRRSKFSPRGEGLFKILTKVNDNAYKVDLPRTPKAAAAFNVTDLQPYYDPDKPISSLRANFLEAGEDDRYNPPSRTH